ncbi:MAG TPA: 4Fe-4S single cluster domain-containing protein [Streptosporangiaceae bacterium]|nr:4Fe-4S single cluster domain-containing protein [Streptosporangiaceae bacterium]
MAEDRDRASRQIVVSRISDRTSVLGPGIRAAVWVRGCPLRCAGCISPEDLPFSGGTSMTVAAVADRLNALPPDVRGVTFSGGEPMAQAVALANLVDALRAARDWSVMSYTGFTLEHLRRHGDAGQHALLARLDVLVDGPYQAGRHASLAWRGSSNQRLHFLTGRHQPPDEDACAGLEFHVDSTSVSWTGVPPVPGFRASFEALMAAEGVRLAVEEQ